jgi:hypothetical protein
MQPWVRKRKSRKDNRGHPWWRKERRRGGIHGEGWEGDGAAALMLAWEREEKGRK